MTATAELHDHLPCASLELVDAVRHWARTTPDQPALTFLAHAGAVSTPTTTTYGQLHRRVVAMAAALVRVSEAGDRIALMLDQHVDYVTSFLACLAAGRVSVPLYAPDLRRQDLRLRAVLAHARPTVIIHDTSNGERVRDLLPVPDSSVRVLSVLDLDDGNVHAEPESGRDPHDVAYLQYTSGSTRAPAGVMVSNANLAAGMTQLRMSVPIGADGPVVSWLPFFHDMGLVFTVAALLQSGGHGIYMSPLAFVQRPIRWLRAISDHRATVTVVPNFGLDFAVGRVADADREGLDLSSLVALCNGSEPVRAASLDAFTATYEPFGFRPEAHRPGYGLAETTLMVSVAREQGTFPSLSVSREALSVGRVEPLEGDGATVVVSCGPAMGQELEIVDPDSDGTAGPLPAGRVGEVWVQGPNSCLGYFENPSLTAEIFGAQVHGTTGTWVRTGDLGFVVDGELYIVGRRKDLVIVGGKNHYPADIEATVLECVPQLRQGAVAAFAHEVDAAEELVVVLEIEPRLLRTLDPDEVIDRVRGAIATNHQLSVHDVVITRLGAIPKTTSGKLQRRACEQKYAEGRLA